MKTNNYEINVIIRNLLLSEIKTLINHEQITDDLDLLSEKIIDSIVFVKLISKLEKVFHIEFTISELAIENFKNIKRMTIMVKSKLKLE